MNAGELRHRITIQALTETRTTRGGTTTVPTAIYTRIPAYVEPLTGRELDRAAEIDPRVRYRVTLRFHRGVMARQAIVYHAFDGDRTLEVVQPPLMDEKDRSMVLMCGEAAA